NWEIMNCNTGIYFYGTNVGISNNYIHNNWMGIALYNSSPTLTLNKLTGNSNYAVSSSGSTSIPKFGASWSQGKNKISGNSVGVCAFSNSLPMLGNNSPLDGGYNTLCANTNYNIYAITNGVIFAVNNYWGVVPPPSSKAYIYNGVIVTSPYLYSDPTGLMKSVPITDDAALALLTKAMSLIENKNFAAARYICLDLVNNYSDSYAAFNALGLLTQTYDLNEKEATNLIYKTLFNKAGKKLNGVAGLILAELDKENKLKILDEVISKFNDDAILEDALFAKFIYYLNDVQDKENARLISNELDRRFPNSITAFDAHHQLGDKDYLQKGYPFRTSDQEQKQNIVGTPLPTEYDLFANYPNPFNPSTTIHYQLPASGHVILKVYDMLGREIAELVNVKKDSGIYTVDFDGSSLSSGTYIYSLKVNEFSQSRKMLLLK
ncbi:MAG: T9SS type A sorting domain-containing protein, partial [Bacteroidetes bacterium]|nr:T9SS type A sorting domain-containing protein [Bacteroidota bacterium]